jgi:hypothetical protein
MTADASPRRRWWKTYELRVYLILTLAALFMLSVGVLLGNGLLAGLSLLLLIFLATYSVYAYLRRDL